MPYFNPEDVEMNVLPEETPIKRLPIDLCFEAEYNSLEENVKKLYQFDETRNCYYLDNETWLKCRQHGEYFDNPSDARYIKTTIGGSDLSALYDGSELSKVLKMYDGQHGSNYMTAIELFYEKTNQELPMKKDNSALEDVFFAGHAVEPVVRSYFERLYKRDYPDDTVKVINDNHMYQCGRRDKDGNLELPFVLCDLDGIVEINGVRGVLECKTCNFTSEDYKLWKNGIVPLKYYLQCCWYMLCMNYPFAYIACTTGIAVSDTVYIYIERNFEVEELIIKMAKEFVKCVESKTEPDVSEQNIDLLYDFWRMKMGAYKPSSPMVKLDDSKLSVVQSLLSIGNEIKVFNEKIDELKEKRKELLVKEIFPVFGDANFGTVTDEDGFYTIKLRKSSNSSIDTDKLKAEKPDLYEKYTKLEPKFNTTLFKKENKALVEEYTDRSSENKYTSTKANYVEITYTEKDKK